MRPLYPVFSLVNPNKLLYPEPPASWGADRPETEGVQVPYADAIHVPGIGNDEGGLVVGALDGKYYWEIEGYESDGWQEIPEYLHSALERFVSEYARSRT